MHKATFNAALAQRVQACCIITVFSCQRLHFGNLLLAAAAAKGIDGLNVDINFETIAREALQYTLQLVQTLSCQALALLLSPISNMLAGNGEKTQAQLIIIGIAQHLQQRSGKFRLITGQQQYCWCAGSAC